MDIRRILILVVFGMYLLSGAEIVVCTPGRFIEILCMQAGKVVSLKRVTMVCFDYRHYILYAGVLYLGVHVTQYLLHHQQTYLQSILCVLYEYYMSITCLLYVLYVHYSILYAYYVYLQYLVLCRWYQTKRTECLIWVFSRRLI